MTVANLFLSLFLFVSLVVIASYCGLLISGLLPWRLSARIRPLMVAFGFALGPFLSGLISVLALVVLPGASHFFHAAFVFFVLTLLAYGLRKVRSDRLAQIRDLLSLVRSASKQSGFLLFLLSLWVLAMVFNALALPLIQNDSLEYMLVARDIYDARSLENYPALSTDTRSGFFGPWTHPSLYVSLIYLASIFQGSAELPFCARLLAPWFALSALMLVFALGAIRSAIVAVLASLLFIGAPLLFLGADSALMDSLPVAGLLLSLTVLVGCDVRRAVKFGLAVGLTLGLSLWTHSQSVIFPFLIFPLAGAYFARKSVRSVDVAISFGAAVGSMLLVGAWPYVANYRTFGSFISDNPAVFAIESLDWVGYFSMARGIHSISEKIQYGLFKGFFATESYGLVFWIAIPVILYFARKSLCSLAFWRSKLLQQNEVVVSLGVLGVYHAGVVASILVGTDLMIKNERYFLVILGPVALLAATTLGHIFGRVDLKSRLLKYAVISVLFLQFAGVEFVYRLRPYTVTAEDQRGWSKNRDLSPLWFEHMYWRLLLRWPQMRVIDYLNQSTRKHENVLTFRPADFFYSKGKMISFLDPRIVPLYSLRDEESLLSGLLALGITALHVPDYFIPPINNSAVMKLLGRDDLTRLVVSEDGSQLYELLSGSRESQRARKTHFLFGGAEDQWTEATVLNIGGRKSMSTLSVIDSIKPGSDRFNLFHREISNLSYPGDGALNRPHTSSRLVTVPSGAEEVSLELDLLGTGFVRVWLLQFDELGVPLRNLSPNSNYRIRIGEIASRGGSNFVRRMTLDSRARYLRVGVETNGNYLVKVNRALASF